jgi:hypothetical protein
MAAARKPSVVIGAVLVGLLVATAISVVEGQAAADCDVDPKALHVCLMAGTAEDLPGGREQCCNSLSGDEDNCLQCELRERLQWKGPMGKILPCIREEVICEVTEVRKRELAEDGSPAPAPSG